MIAVRMVFWPGCSFPVRFIASSISRLAACSGLFYHLSAFFGSREMFLCPEILCQGKNAGRYHIPTDESFDDVYDLQFTSHMKRALCSHLKFLCSSQNQIIYFCEHSMCQHETLLYLKSSELFQQVIKEYYPTIMFSLYHEAAGQSSLFPLSHRAMYLFLCASYSSCSHIFLFLCFHH